MVLCFVQHVLLWHFCSAMTALHMWVSSVTGATRRACQSFSPLNEARFRLDIDLIASLPVA